MDRGDERGFIYHVLVPLTSELIVFKIIVVIIIIELD